MFNYKLKVIWVESWNQCKLVLGSYLDPNCLIVIGASGSTCGPRPTLNVGLGGFVWIQT